ncbi:hypothetical protein Q7P35_007112 [Cladosporium inversicolor]
MERHHRAAKQNSTNRGTYSAGSIVPKPRTAQNVSPPASTSGTVVSPSKTNKSSKKGKEKAVESVVEPETDEEERVAPRRRRPLSVREKILKNYPNYFKKQYADKAKRDRQAALAAEESSAANDTETITTTKPAKIPASKKSAPTKRTPAATKSTKSSTIQDGKIKKAANVKKQPQKSKRKHRPADYGYETVPDDSDDGEKQRDTIAKLRETIDRHARWCHDNATTEPEEDEAEENDEDAEVEEDQSNAESDEGEEDTQPPKTKQTKQTATTKPPTSKAASSKKIRFEHPDLLKEREETSDGAEANDGAESEVPEADESEDEGEADIAAATTEINSDEELSSLDNDKFGQLKEAHEQEQNDLNRQATDLSSDKDAGSPKRKGADLESGKGEKEPAKKQRRST